MNYVRPVLIMLVSVPLWIAYTSLLAILILLGLPICYMLARRCAWVYVKSPHFDRYVHAWRPRWAEIWGNWEDGVIGPDWYWAKHPGRSAQSRAFRWSALRNPANNLRFVPVINPIIEPHRIRYIGNADDPSRRGIAGRRRIEWALTWQGFYAGLVWRWQITRGRHAQIRIGWKLLPRDRLGVPPTDYRHIRCPFGLQVHLWRSS